MGVCIGTLRGSADDEVRDEGLAVIVSMVVRG